MITDVLLIERLNLCRLLQWLENRGKALQDKHEDLRRDVAQRQLEVRYLTQQPMFTEQTRAFISAVPQLDSCTLQLTAPDSI